MKLREDAVVLLATGFHIGNIPFAPGTLGSLLGLPLGYALAEFAMPVVMICALLFIFFAVWIAHAAEKILKQKDPGCIVIDEIAGMIVTLIGLPFNRVTVVLGFILFRVLDIIKPYPIRNLDKRLPGGLGVVADDVVAGIIANLLLRIIIHIL